MKCLRNLATLWYVIALIEATGATCGAQERPNEQLAKEALWGPSSHGWQLGIAESPATFAVGKPINVVVVVRYGGPTMDIHPLEPQGFYTRLVNSDGRLVALDEDWGAAELNSTGINEYSVHPGDILERTLHIDRRYTSLAPGTYRLTASIDIVPGSSMDAVPKPVFAHLSSGTATITIQP